MSNKLQLSSDQLRELLCEATQINTRSWRHGHLAQYVFESKNKHYSIWIPVHHNEGWVLEEASDPIEVHKVTKVIDVWEPK